MEASPESKKKPYYKESKRSSEREDVSEGKEPKVVRKKTQQSFRLERGGKKRSTGKIRGGKAVKERKKRKLAN